MPSKTDIEDEEEIDIAVRVLDVEEWNHDKIAYKLTCRDTEQNRLELTAFHADEVPAERWERGDWYKLSRARGSVHRGSPGLTLNFGDCDIEKLDEPPVETGGEEDDATTIDPDSIADIADRQITDTVRTTSAHTDVTDTGTYLSQFPIDVGELTVHRYDLDASGNGWTSPGRLVNKFANSLWNQTGIPTSQYDEFSIVALERVDVETVRAYGMEASLKNHQRVTVSPKANPKVIENLVTDAIKNVIVDDGGYRVEGIYSIESVRPRHRSEDGRFEAADEYDIGARVDSEGNVLASVETSYSLRSGVSVAELLDDVTIQLTGLYAEHVTEYGNYASGRIAYVDEDTRYTDPLPELGGDSVADYHRQRSRAPDSLIDEIAAQNPPLVYIYYSNGSDPKPQAPHFLRLSPSLDVLSSLNGAFLGDIASEMKQTPEQRFERAAWFVEQMGDLDELDTSVRATPSNGAYARWHAEDVVSSPNLEFAGGRLAPFGKAGLTDYGVYEAPESFDLLALVPEQFDSFDHFFTSLKNVLEDIGASLDSVDIERYSFGSESDYSRAAGGLTGYDAALVPVPNKGQADEFPNLDDPFDEMKRTLGRNGVGSQMVERQTLREADRGTVRNVAAGLVGAAGGIPWRVAEMPGGADCFIGLDVTYDHNRDQHRGAAATITHADGTVYASRSYAVQEGEKFNGKDARRMFNDLLNEYEDAHGEAPDNVVVHRDGVLYESIEDLLEPFEARDASLDIVEVKKSKVPRVGEFDGSKFVRPAKGSGHVDSNKGDAILATTGGKEHRIGTPRPIRLNHRHGDTDLGVLASQAYWLSEAHVGSVSRSTRLPITTHYADKYAQHVQDGFLASDEVIKGLPFL